MIEQLKQLWTPVAQFTQDNSWFNGLLSLTQICLAVMLIAFVVQAYRTMLEKLFDANASSFSSMAR